MTELERLLAALESQRGAVLKKLSGLSDEDARRSTVPSGTNLAGLVQRRYGTTAGFETFAGPCSP